MPHAEEPVSKTDRLVFALLWAGFIVLLAVLARWMTGVLIPAAAFTAAAAAISILFNDETPRTRQAASLAFPVGLALIWLLARTDPAATAIALIVLAVTGGLAMAASETVGTTARRWWINAGAPIGWSISAVLLALVYFLVITPIGLLRRLGGADPMTRAFSDEPSYWTPRETPTDPRRHYRQF